MPLRPDLPSGLNLSRRATTPVKLPKISFPMIGGVADSAHLGAVSPNHAGEGPIEGTLPLPEEDNKTEEAPVMRSPVVPPYPQPAPVETSRTASRVIVYGKSGCPACVSAIQDLIDRRVSFTYYDVERDPNALQHLESICGGEAMVPVIVQVGFGGT